MAAENISNSILRGDVVVRVLKIGTGRNLGPGCYPVNSTDLAKVAQSHNIRTRPDFTELKVLNASFDRSSVRKSEEESKCFIDLGTQPGARNVYQAKDFRPSKTAHSGKESVSQVCSMTMTTTNESPSIVRRTKQIERVKERSRVYDRMQQLAQGMVRKRQSAGIRDCTVCSMEPVTLVTKKRTVYTGHY